MAALQQRLIDLGHGVGPAGVDGDFGTDTREAVQDFQDVQIDLLNGALDRLETEGVPAHRLTEMAALRTAFVEDKALGQVRETTGTALEEPLDAAGVGAWAERIAAPDQAGGASPSVAETRRRIEAILRGESDGTGAQGAPDAAPPGATVPDGAMPVAWGGTGYGAASPATHALLALEAHPPTERAQILAGLDDGLIRTWVERMNGRPVAELEPLLPLLVVELSAPALDTVFRHADAALAEAYLGAIAEHADPETAERFVRLAQERALEPEASRLGEADRRLYLDLAQMALDLAGIVDPIGITNAANAGISLYRGDWFGAALSAAAIVPVLGNFALAGKLDRWAATTEAVIDRALVDSGFRRAAEPFLEGVEAMLDRAGNELGALVPESYQDRIATIQQRIEDFKTTPSNDLGLRVPTRYVDEFASMASGDFGDWKRGLLAAGYSRREVAEIVYEGSLKRGNNMWGNNWRRYLEEITSTTMPSTQPGATYHAHHLVEKTIKPNAPNVAANHAILRSVGIDPLLNRENLFWAPFREAEIHGNGPQGELRALLEAATSDKSGEVARDAVEQALYKWAMTVATVRRC